jgi:outer membrane protein
MKRKGFCVALFLMLTLAFCFQPVWSASAAKIGYFDIREVQSKSKWGEQIKQELTRVKDKYQGDVDAKLKAFKDKRDDFEKKKAVLDEKARTKQTQELQTLQQEAERLLRESQGEMGRQQERLIPPMNDKILEIVRSIGQKDGYDYILEKAAIAFATPKDDLTSRIISELNRVTPAQ